MTQLKLLYVDDEKVNLINFEIAFKRKYQILTASSGQEALEIFDDNDDIAIVVADQRMPGMTGVELLQEIRQRNEDVMRVILTAYSETGDIIDSINKGNIYQYVLKPWTEKELEIILHEAGEKYRLVRENKRLVQELKEDIQKRKEVEGVLVRRNMALAEITDMAMEVLLNSGWQLYAEKLLARLGIVMAVSRARIFEHRQQKDGELAVELSFKWIAEHQAAGQDDSSPADFIYSKAGLARWPAIFSQGEMIVTNVGELPEEEKPFFQGVNIQSICCAPILTGETCWGFISFEDCCTERKWARPELDALKTGATLLGTAITRQRMEQDIVSKQAQLAHAGRLAVLGEMASGIGHEIYQPLSVINLSAETGKAYLAQEKNDEFLTESLEDIEAQVGKIMRLVDGMRRFSRLSSEQSKRISLAVPLENTLIFFKEQFRLNNIAFEVNLDDSLPLISIDSQKFEQVLINFLSNANHAVEEKNRQLEGYEKKIVVSVYCKEIEPGDLRVLAGEREGELTGNMIILEVCDNGIGMDETIRRRCLEPFFTTKDMTEGTGLGLSVSYQIIQGLNFHLEIESVAGEGATFRLYIPVNEEESI